MRPLSVAKPFSIEHAVAIDNAEVPLSQKGKPCQAAFLVDISRAVQPLCFFLSTVIGRKAVNAFVVARLLIGITEPRPGHRLGAVRPTSSLCRAPLSSYVHSQILPFELPSAPTSYSNTAAMPFSLANFSELV